MKPEDTLKAEPRDPNSERVAAIVKRAKHEVAAKDLLEFGGARIWLALLTLLGRYLSFFGKSQSDTFEVESASETKQGKRENSS